MDKVTWTAINALYGNGKPPEKAEVDKVLAKRKDSVSGSETEEQKKFVAWLKRNNILVAHFANGGYRHRLEAYNLKLLGVSPGIPDLLIPMARKGYHSLFIEMKRVKGGVLSEPQKWWLEQLTKEGHLAVAANGFEEAKRIAIDYFDLKE